VGILSNPTAIKPNQKFSLVTLSANVDDALPENMPFQQGLWATRKLPVALDDEWKKWIGSIRAERIGEDCNLFLCAAMDSGTPGVLDHENKQLDSAAMRLFDGLMLAGNVQTTVTPILLGGAHQQDGMTVRSISDLRRPLIPAGVDYDDVTADMTALAYRHMMGRINFERITSYDRIARVLFIFDNAVVTPSVHERLHQFCCCIEGLILPSVGKTEKQFVSRTELFVGPSHHDTMRALYKMRSKVEHMHEYDWPAGLAERDRRLLVMRRSALAQELARQCISRFLVTEDVWPYYTSPDQLASFWNLSATDRQKLWGPPLDLDAIDRKFDPAEFTDETLCLR
jgi:hypothetical protein